MTIDQVVGAVGGVVFFVVAVGIVLAFHNAS